MDCIFSMVTPEQALDIARTYKTPTYVYGETALRQRAQEVLNFPSAFGVTARYAMKANSNRTILRLFDQMGLHFDAFSVQEVHRALAAGISPSKILLTAKNAGDRETLET